MAQIPARVGRQGYGLVGHANAADFVAVLVHRRYQARVGRTHYRWHLRRNALLRSEVEAREAPQGLWKSDPRESPKGIGETLCRHRSAGVETRIAAGWGRLPAGDPAVEVHQGSAQQRPIVGPVEGLLATHALPWISISQGEGTHWMLGPAEVVNAHRVRHLKVAAAGDIDMYEGPVAATVFG